MSDFFTRIFSSNSPNTHLPPDALRELLLSQLTTADAKLSFSMAASPGESGWQKWLDAMRAISRLPGGIPNQFRRKLWVGLADNYLASNRIDWNSVTRTAFNDKSNPDDSALGLQIVKDLHRTGCSNSFLPQNADVDAERTLLKRVLLAYARWNKQVGYCQGFNVLATVILDTVDRSEVDALKVMIYLIDHVLPANYYSNCLRLLAVDLAVFRHLLAANLPQLAQHLDKLQKKATTADDGIFYEPPLTNVFLMQWLLTLYATCLPKHALLRLWDSLMLHGSENLLSAGLHIFTKLSKQIIACNTVDQYYTSMEKNVKNILKEGKPGSQAEADAFIQAVYKELTPSVGELREQLLYSIQPFMAASSTPSSSAGEQKKLKDAYATSGFGCFSVCGRSLQHATDNSSSGFNKNNEAYISGLTEEQLREIGAVRERMTTDLKKLKRNYDKLAKNRQSAVVVVPSALDSTDLPATNSQQDSSQNQSQSSKLSRSYSVSSGSHHQQQINMNPLFMTSNFDLINHLLVSKVGLEEVNQKVMAAPMLEMILPAIQSQQSTSPSSPPTYSKRRFSSVFSHQKAMPAAQSTANKYVNPQHNLHDTGFSSLDFTQMSQIHEQSLLGGFHSLTLDSLTSSAKRDVLSSLPTSPEKQFTRNQPVLVTTSSHPSELVEIDISSDCGDYYNNASNNTEDDPSAITPTMESIGGSGYSHHPNRIANYRYSAASSEDSENSYSYFAVPPQHPVAPSSLLMTAADGEERKKSRHPSQSYLEKKFPIVRSSAINQHQNFSYYDEPGAVSKHSAVEKPSPFPISTAARFRQRLHLIPGVKPAPSPAK